MKNDCNIRCFSQGPGARGGSAHLRKPILAVQVRLRGQRIVTCPLSRLIATTPLHTFISIHLDRALRASYFFSETRVPLHLIIEMALQFPSCLKAIADSLLCASSSSVKIARCFQPNESPSIKITLLGLVLSFLLQRHVTKLTTVT